MDTSSTKTNDLKRSLNDSSEYGTKKKVKSDEVYDLISGKSFIDLSEDVLLILFSHISHNDLISLARTCKRMDRVVRDWTLWKNINSVSNPMPMTQLKEFIPYLLDITEEVKLSFENEPLKPGDNETETLENEESGVCLEKFLNHLSLYCKMLTTLALEHVTVDARRFQITIFPSTLKNFSLKHSKLVNLSSDVSYFYGFDTHFPNIEALNLSWCNWFTPHSLIALSKSKNLEELYLQGCRKIKNCVPYTSLSVRFGFKALKILDLRFTYISDSEVTIIHDLPCLSHLYLAAPTPKRLEDFSISDRSITMLCTTSPRNDQNGFEVYHAQRIGAALRLLPIPDTTKVAKSFHTLVVTGYPSITDISLRHAANCLRGLQLLDVRGGSCTREGIDRFRLARPEVTLLCGPDDLEPQHPPDLVFDPPSPIPLLPGLRVVLHRIENNQPVIPIEVVVGRNNNLERGDDIGNAIRIRNEIIEDVLGLNDVEDDNHEPELQQQQQQQQEEDQNPEPGENNHEADELPEND